MIALINYNAGNTASVENALADIGADYIVTERKAEAEQCDKIILPGVGEASSAMRRLNDNGIGELLKQTKKPVLGICLGLQLFGVHSTEGDTYCLGILPYRVTKFNPAKAKVTHMGWNSVIPSNNNRLFKGIENGKHFYFANSFFVDLTEYTTATAYHEKNFTAALQCNNYYGVQFHPEKSGGQGLQLLTNFTKL